MQWVIEQTWRHVLFLHWRVDAQELQTRVPFPLDLHDGKAVLSIVPFRMEEIRFPFLPAPPFLSSLWELNLRTYVIVNGVPGIYFFTLDTDHRIAREIAERFFRLPYRLATVTAKIEKSRYEFKSRRVAADFSVVAEFDTKLKPTSAFDHWVTERYSVFLEKQGHAYQGVVMHDPWQLSDARILTLKNGFFEQIAWNNCQSPIEVSYSAKLKVRFKPFVKIANSPLHFLENAKYRAK